MRAHPPGRRESRLPVQRRRTRAAALLVALSVAGGAVALGPSVAVVAAEEPTAATEGRAAGTPPTVNLWKGVNPVTELTGESFANPPANDKAWVRWNFPPATTPIPRLEKDLDELAAAGIAGVEIGQGGNPTNEQLQAILIKANALDITVGIKYSGGAPVTGTWVDTDDRTRKTLNNAKTLVDAGTTFNGPVPGTGTIVAVLAYRCTTAPCASTGVREVERSSVVNLTSSLTGTNTDGFSDGTTTGNLTWTAPTTPAGAQWVVVTVRSVAFQAAPEVLTRAGTDAMIAGYEALWTPEIKALLKENRSDIFVDSHPNDPWGTPTELWSTSMAADFQARTGYSIVSDLAALFYNEFKYSDGRDERVRTDFYQVRNDLFIANRIKPFTDWAHTHGMTLRLQPEDPNIGGADAPYQDQIDMATNLERPEHESLVGDQIDVWRAIASANSWTGNPWFSEECCAVGSQNYVETLQDVQERMNKSFAAGITKNVYHVYPTTSSPTSTFPGYSNFGPTSFSGAWGPRNPNWASDGLQVNTWMARNQQVLTQGRSDIDVAVYLHSFEWPAGSLVNTDGTPWNGRHWDDQAMQRAGYSWDYVNPKLLSSPMAAVTDGVLAADGPSYKVLVVNTGINPARHPRKLAMPVATAKRILEMAEDGLKVVLVGEAPNVTPGDRGDDAELKAVISDLLAQPTVSRVASEAGVPSKLAALGVQPDAKPSERTTLFSRHLKDRAAATDYYFLYNQGEERLEWGSRDIVYEEPEACRYTGVTRPCRSIGEPIDVDVTLTGTGAPYLLDTDSGEITPIPDYSASNGKVTVRVALGRNQSTIVALTEDPVRLGVEALPVHVVSTTADSAAVVDGELVVRDTTPGTYTATLSDGSTRTVTVAGVAPAIDLTDATWQLQAEDWKPANPFGATGEEGAAITKDPVALTLDGLAAWPDIPELKNASGVGTYTTTVTMPADWKTGHSAMLSLGQVVDTVNLEVNGTTVPINTLRAAADVGPYLTAGENTMVVRVSTTLNNRLAAVIPAVATRGVVQEYGLVGPVTLTPSGQATVADLDPDAPVSITPPSVTGTVRVGSTVTCDPGAWTGAERFNYAWTVSGKVVSGATGATLKISPALVSRTITCRVTATGPGGQRVEQSAGVRVGKGPALVATTRPTIAGVTSVGNKLTARPGTWRPAAASYRFTWKRAGATIRGATGSTYRVSRLDRGKRLTVTVTAVSPAYASGSATSPARWVASR